LNPERVGRDGFLRLRFARRSARTILAQSCFSLPLQALTPLALEDGSCYLMLLNPTGGVLGGDRLATEIVLEAGTHAILTTPSATRVYRTAEKPAILNTVIQVGEGSTLEYLPDHVIPHGGSLLHQSLRIEMEPGSRAIVLDAMASGRVAHGERWSFRELDSQTSVRLRGKPIYINRARITPRKNRPDQLGIMKEFDYMASLGIFADGFSRWEDLITRIKDCLVEEPNVYSGASLLSRGGCAIRFLARSAPEMTNLNKKLWDAARECVAGLTPLDHRKY
jgi:urease accessory protein